jgi:hypothetical protein
MSAQAQPSAPSFEIDPHPTVTATVSTEFTIQLWIRDIPNGFSVAEIPFVVEWYETEMELVRYQEFTPPGKNWLVVNREIGINYYVLTVAAETLLDSTDLEMAWVSLTFHCLAEGSSDVGGRVRHVILYDGETTYDVSTEAFLITVNQNARAPVGGVPSPINKLGIITPYLA